MESQKLEAPGYPSVAGQSQPDLNLAGLTPPPVEHMPPVIQSMATPPQNLGVPALSTNNPLQDMLMLGIDPTIPFNPLNLAGNDELAQSPASLVRPIDQTPINQPTFYEPHVEVPPLQKDFDLVIPGIDMELHAEHLAVDLPQLTDPVHPHGLFMLDHLAMRDPTLPMQPPDQHNGLEPMSQDPWAPDPMLPDLQHPDLSQEVLMQDRPADLATGALDDMHNTLTYQQLDNVPYKQAFMDQRGTNTTHRRHMDLLMRGLDAEEEGKSL